MTTKNTIRVSEKQKRFISCPVCGARPGRPCRSSRIPGANTLGGGWGGPPALGRAHAERRAEYLAAIAPETTPEPEPTA